ncbi:MAG: YdbL family protein [Pseudomonadota bacterium]|nr:YdbL family protein [Pseudomonadota bacterium]
MKKTVRIAAIAAALLVAGASSAFAMSVAEAKAQCIVGEQYDGYLGFANEAAADEALKREVRGINQQRRTAYEGLAQRNGVSVDVTAALTAEKLMNQAPSGQCIRDQSGWRKK